MALTDTEIRRAKSKDKAYNLTDGGGLRLEITPAGGSCGVGSIGMRARKN